MKNFWIKKNQWKINDDREKKIENNALTFYI